MEEFTTTKWLSAIQMFSTTANIFGVVFEKKKCLSVNQRGEVSNSLLQNSILQTATRIFYDNTSTTKNKDSLHQPIVKVHFPLETDVLKTGSCSDFLSLVLEDKCSLDRLCSPNSIFSALSLGLYTNRYSLKPASSSQPIRWCLQNHSSLKLGSKLFFTSLKHPFLHLFFPSNFPPLCQQQKTSFKSSSVNKHSGCISADVISIKNKGGPNLEKSSLCVCRLQCFIIDCKSIRVYQELYEQIRISSHLTTANNPFLWLTQTFVSHLS